MLKMDQLALTWWKVNLDGYRFPDDLTPNKLSFDWHIQWRVRMQNRVNEESNYKEFFNDVNFWNAFYNVQLEIRIPIRMFLIAKFEYCCVASIQFVIS